MNKAINYWIFGISIILLGASLFVNISNVVINNQSIVLIFIGILATFIVVSNYAQVSEIKNSTDKKVQDLETETKDQIKQLNILFKNVEETKEKLTKTEKNTYLATAEAYRLYAIYTYDKKQFRNSTGHLIGAMSYYFKTGEKYGLEDNLLDNIISNLELEKWNSSEVVEGDFNYKDNLKKVKEFPKTCSQRNKILKLIAERKKEETEKKK